MISKIRIISALQAKKLPNEKCKELCGTPCRSFSQVLCCHIASKQTIMRSQTACSLLIIDMDPSIRQPLTVLVCFVSCFWKLYLKSCIFYSVVCCMFYVVYCILYVIYCMMHVVICIMYSMLYIVFCKLHVACCMLHVARCMLYVVCCMLYAVCCMLFVLTCMMYAT